MNKLVLLLLLLGSTAPFAHTDNKTVETLSKCKNLYKCIGYNGPGGVCYDGPGGPLYDGPGGTGEKCSIICHTTCLEK